MRRLHDLVFHNEEIGVIGFRNETIDIQHDRTVNSRDVRFNGREDVVEQIVVMDL